MSHFPDERLAVLVGQGEVSDRPADPAQGREPLALLEDAVRRAGADSAPELLREIDSLDVVNFLSWRYDDPAARLAARLGATPTHCAYGPVGGESPIRYLHEAAKRIARGEARVVIVCGAESQGTATKAARANIDLPWTPFAHDAPEPLRGAAYQRPLAVKLGVDKPVTVYPLYEMASSAHWGQTPRQALAESGALWAGYADVAAQNASSWLKRAVPADEIVTPTPANRMIAWPYTKLMVANPTVNMGAALVVTSLARARAAGIAEDRIVHIVGGASAEEPRDYLSRDQYVESHAQNAVLGRAVQLAGGDARAFGAIELYSCFPTVPKMARRTLRLDEDVVPTVTGGLTFFGAPLNNYMGHAACAMLRTMRGDTGHAPSNLGLLYGQGGFVTKHHALVLSRAIPEATLAQDTDVQADADSSCGAVPAFVAEASGEATVETYTVIYGAAGAPEHGAVVLRLPDGRRTLARVDVSDAATLGRLLDADVSAVGLRGTVTMAGDVPQWRANSSS